MVLIISIMFLVFGLEVVDKAVRDMMHIQDKQLYIFDYDDEFLKFHLLGRDYFIDRKEIDEKINSAKVVAEEFVKSADNYLDKIWTKIKTR